MRFLPSSRLAMSVAVGVPLLVAASACDRGADKGRASTPVVDAPPGCLTEAVGAPRPGEPADSWARARTLLPAPVIVLQPGPPASAFGPPVLKEACVDRETSQPRYTVMYSGLQESNDAVVFILSAGFAEWGNFPGPVTSSERATVRGNAAQLLTTSEISATTPGLTAMLLTWKEDGSTYSIGANTTGQLTSADLLRIAESLTPVR